MDSEDFGKFLTWLDPDREKAGEKYENIQRKLTRYFLCRGCGLDAEALADETITRVIKLAPRIADSYVGERMPYFLGVARLVYLEYIKNPKPIEVDPAHDLAAPIHGGDDKELRDRCLTRCFKGHSNENRDLILRYYTGEKSEKILQRTKLADELGIATNALRIRAHRIRTDLRRCVEACITEANNDEWFVAV